MMKYIVYLFIVMGLLIGCSSNDINDENSVTIEGIEKISTVNNKDVSDNIETIDNMSFKDEEEFDIDSTQHDEIESATLPFDVERLKENYQNESEMSSEKMSNMLYVTDSIIVFTGGSLSESILFLSMLISYVDDEDDEIKAAMNDLEESGLEGAAYSSTVMTDSTTIITVLEKDHIIISVSGREKE